MKKSNRQGVIRRLIQDYEIETQEELISFLKKEEVNATQATVSRDIRELGIVKGHSSQGRVKYVMNEQAEPPTKERLREVVADTVENISRVEFTLVMQTTLGSANMVAAVIDELNLAEVAGTIAGADTIVVIARGKDEAKAFEELISTFLND